MNTAHAALPKKRRLAMLARTLRSIAARPQPRTFPALSAAHLPALRGRVDIARDAHGIPHIYAEHEADLYAALGFLQAADRFPLLDIARHLGAGRLCELIGNPVMPRQSEMFAGKRLSDLDGFVRPLALEADSVRDAERLSTRGRACLEAFASGINAALRAMRGVYPAEYVLLGPLRPWLPSDALLAARTCALVVALAPLDVELAFDAVRGHLGDTLTQLLYPEAPWQNVPTTYPPLEGAEPEAPLHLAGTGSNNWTVSGARSASGAPIFANDPHVPFLPLPTFWYHAHLDCPRYRIQGGLMLGCPIFGYGHNGFLAWGVTTAFRDAWDLYRIHRLPDDRTRYRTVHGTGAISAQHEPERVRFGRSLTLAWERCDHGILYPGWTHHDGIDLAVRYVPSDAAHFFDGYLMLAEAQTVAAHRAALERINDGPFDFNHMYAHSDGHIAWEPYGRLPRRSTDGLFVRDAHDPQAQWDGFLPFADNPKIINPARGFIASANSLTDPDNCAALTTAVHVEPPLRQNRIEAALAASTTHSADTFAALQRDVGSTYGMPIRDALVRCLAAAATRPDVVSGAHQILREWDGTFATTSAGAALFSCTLRQLAPRCFLPLLGTEAGRRYLNTRRAVPRLHRLLLDSADPLLAQIERASRQPFPQLVSDAFAAAVAQVVAHCGAAPEQWQWGRVQRLRLATLLGELPVIGRPFRALDAPFPGDSYTVSPSVSFPIGNRLRSFVGATSRFICDLARPDEALFAHSSGPSGDIGTTFCMPPTQAWYRFEYFRAALWKLEDIPNVVERVTIAEGGF